MKEKPRYQERYPYMFARKNMGIFIPTGWWPIFETLCEDIDALLGQDKRGFHFIQCKEKFGSALWYWDMRKVKRPVRVDILCGDDPVTALNGPNLCQAPVTLGEQIGQLVRDAEARTLHACIVCGESSKADNFEGYILQVCAVHKRMRRKGTLPNFWPSEDA
jgi:hypothetical protein